MVRVWEMARPPVAAKARGDIPFAMTLTTFAFFLLGLVLLIVGAEVLVRGASRLARALGLSPLVIGLTVVAFGTSSPELAVSLQAAMSPAGADIALGNVVGSNIFNVLFILGLAALISPLVVSQKLVRWELPLLVGISIATFVMALDGWVGRLDGALLAAGIVAYTVLAVRQGRKESREVQAEYEAEIGPPAEGAKGMLLNLVLIGVGLALLVVGSDWLVEGAVVVARGLGISELVISLTLIAAGTSLPEVATSILATLRGEREIAVGNVVGSNIFNLLAVLGLASLLSPEGIRVAPAALHFDLPVMIAVAVICLPIFFTGSRISRGEGALFFGYYLIYTVYLLLAANQHDALPWINTALVAGVLPLTVLALAISMARQVRGKGV